MIYKHIGNTCDTGKTRRIQNRECLVKLRILYSINSCVMMIYIIFCVTHKNQQKKNKEKTNT